MEQPAIRTQNLCKTYQMGQTPVEALADVTLEIFPGEFVSIMGKSGSGKSTLLHLMGGLIARPPVRSGSETRKSAKCRNPD